MSDTTVAIIGALISGPIGIVMGTAFGYLLNEYSIRRRELHAEEQRDRNVRILLFRETEEDLEELRNYLSRAKRQQNGAVWEGTAAEIVFQVRRQFLQFPRPRLSHVCWESQLSLAPAVLTRQQLRDAYLFHSQLDKLESLYAVLNAGAPDETLCRAYDDWKATTSAQKAPLEHLMYFSYPNGEMMGPAPDAKPHLLSFELDSFQRRNAATWSEYEGLINGLLQHGNPLPDPDEIVKHKKMLSRWAALASGLLLRAVGERKNRPPQSTGAN